MEKLNELTEFIKAQARELAKNEEHCPMLFVITPDRGVGITPISGFDKDHFQEIVSNGLRREGATGYVLVNEAWMAKFVGDKKSKSFSDSPWLGKLLKGEISVSELPPDDRIEALMLTSVENGKSYVVWQAKIEYSTDGRRIIGSWEKIIDTAGNIGKLDGRLVLKSW